MCDPESSVHSESRVWIARQLSALVYRSISACEFISAALQLALVGNKPFLGVAHQKRTVRYESSASSNLPLYSESFGGSSGVPNLPHRRVLLQLSSRNLRRLNEVPFWNLHYRCITRQHYSSCPLALRCHSRVWIPDCEPPDAI